MNKYIYTIEHVINILRCQIHHIGDFQNPVTKVYKKVVCSLSTLNQPIPKTSFDVKKGEPKKMQVTERLKSVKSLWGQEEKIHQQGCVELQHTKRVR